MEADVHGSCLPWRHGLVAYVPLWYGLVRSRRSRTVWYALGGLGVLKRSGQGCPPIRRSSGACVQSVRSVGIVKSVGIVSSVAKVRVQSPHINTECVCFCPYQTSKLKHICGFIRFAVSFNWEQTKWKRKPLHLPFF